MPVSRKIKKADIDVYEFIDSAVESRIVDTTRWSIVYRIVVPYEGKFYITTYHTGATEYQDESAWQYDDEIELIEVQKVQKFVDVWEPV